MTRTTIDLAALRAKLSGQAGRPLWRSLEAVAETPEFAEFLTAEFPAAYAPPPGSDRRRFLQLMAASFAFGGLAGCDDPPDGRSQEVPYVRDPVSTIPAIPLHYASAALLDGVALGVVVTTRNGRPIKIEGNDRHPWTRGGTDVFSQASVLELYDPERSQAVRHLGRISGWETFNGVMAGAFGVLRAKHGEGLRLLSGPISSPTLLAQVAAMQTAFPAMRWHVHAPVGRDAAYQGAHAAFGQAFETRWRFDRADVVVSLDGDMLDQGPHQIGVSRDWIDARRTLAKTGKLLTLFSAGPTPTLTSGRADDRVAVDQRDMTSLAADLLQDIGAGKPTASDDAAAQWRARATTALLAARGRGIVLAGYGQPPAVHEAVHRINAALGNLGVTVFLTAPVTAQAEPLESLVADAAQGRVDTLIMLDTNPCHTAPTALGFTAALEKVRLKLHTGLYFDETAEHADWHLPAAHSLESWGDARAFDGTVTLIQPTIRPFYAGRSASEVLSLLVDPQPRSGRDILYNQHRGQQSDAAFAAAWQKMLDDGFIAGSAFPEQTPPPLSPMSSGVPPAAQGLDVVFRPDPSIWDGRFGNNGWLQELPKPLSKIVWNAALSISPHLAEREHLRNGDVVALQADGRRLEGPVWISPGQATNTVTATLGYGRRMNAGLCAGIGYDATALQDPALPALLSGVVLHRTERHVSLVTTQDHHTMEGTDFIRVQRLGAAPVGENVSFTQPTLYDRDKSDGRAWGMVIDIDACIGCNACVIACQSENNSPVVGPEQVAEGRDMHWLRVDRYHEGGLDDAGSRFMPVPCMHCEQAPCEVGCPVEATLHDSEGLNLMVYNRCIGTRACSSYCPYKVRRFNYLDYTEPSAASTRAGRNPDVTVRARGVMEKCTYCVQRIAGARITADKENRGIYDGEVRTACQSACPTRAITFGDLANQSSEVHAARRDPRNYSLLGELNTRPRTTYLAALAAGSEQG